MATITQENIDAQNATVKIQLSTQDYEPLVSESLKKLSKKADVKGFRKGMVPVGHIKKLYGNEVLADELNNLINKELTKYLTDNKIEILGSPIPKLDDGQQELDIHSQKEYQFSYDLGLHPHFDVSALSDATKVNQYTVKTDEQAVEKEVERLRKRVGEMTNPEDGVAKDDILFVKFQELDEAGNVKEGGVENSTAVPLEKFEDKVADQLLGKKPGEYLDVEMMKALKADEEQIIHNYLKLTDHRHLNKTFRVHLTKINRAIPAEVNQVLFDKVFGEGAVKSVEEFREKLKSEIEKAYVQQGEQLLNRDIVNMFIENTNVNLPDAFLKRWIQVSSEKPVTMEQVEHDYNGFAKNLKWTLIVNKIKKENNLEVTPDEMKAHTIKVMGSYYGFPDNEETNKMLGALADDMLKKEEHAKRTYEELADKKVLDFMKSKITLTQKEISVEEFGKLE
ncbi:MAG: trigger factor [Chitinophagales bacterium]|nr:trigger factor [Chitinophagales bacterium]